MIDLDGKKAKIQIWDTSGQETFGALSHSYYRGMHGFILCYGINNRKSFEYWMEEIKKYARKDACVILVGTKSDLSDERVVGFDEEVQKAESLGIKFFEISSKKNLNIHEAFLEVTREALSKKKNNTQEPGTKLHSRENNPKT